MNAFDGLAIVNGQANITLIIGGFAIFIGVLFVAAVEFDLWVGHYSAQQKSLSG